jgi:hypothetical protein
MKFLSKWIYKKFKQGRELAEESMIISATTANKLGIAEPGHRIDSDRGIRFNVYKATGGTIIETSFYDRQRDRHHSSLHVITEDKDIGKELGKIITMESLKT